MLTYRGDKFVKGKKFKINESEYYFNRRDDDKLVFNTIDSKPFIITEEEFNKAENILTEKINQENKEINDIIGKALRSKTVARKYEDLLKSKGIEVDYDKSQGVSLKGPNGNYLSASSKEVSGPTAPGFNSTHARPNDRKERYAEEERESAETYRKELEKLKAMSRDDIIRKYNKLDSKEALKKYKDEIKKFQEYIKQAEEWADSYEKEYEADKERNKRYKRAGHKLAYTRDVNIDREKADKTVDYLNYLTKKYYERPNKDDYWNQDYVAGNEKEEFDQDNPKWSGHYYGRNGYPGKRSETLNQYDELKRDIERAKEDVDWHTYSDNDRYNSSYAAMTDEQLEAKIAKMREDLEKEIEKLRADNTENQGRQSNEIKELQAKEKALDDFLKSKGVREAVLSIINGKLLNESVMLTEKINQENEKINTIISKALQNKKFAKEHEDEIKAYGIDIDYSKPKGVILKGPNGKELELGKGSVWGPSVPGHNETHTTYRSNNTKRDLQSSKERLEQYTNKLKELESLTKEEILKKYPKIEEKRALSTHKREIDKYKKYIERTKDEIDSLLSKYKSSAYYDKQTRRAGHKVSPGYDANFGVSYFSSNGEKQLSRPESESNKYVDYLNYLTKKIYKDQDRDTIEKNRIYDFDIEGSDKQVYDDDGKLIGSYTGRHGLPNIKGDTLQTYDKLKADVNYAKDDAKYSKPMTDKQLEKRIEEIRASFEEEIKKEVEDLKNRNNTRRSDHIEKIKELKDKEKALADFLKSKKVQEIALSIINGSILNESLVDSGNPDADYIETRLSEIYDDVLTLAQEASQGGFKECSRKLDDILSLLENISIK